MAKANPVKIDNEDPVENTSGPVIEYFGEKAREVKFEADPKAVRIRVYETGLILTDY